MLTNLLDETIAVLKENGKSWKDVRYIVIGTGTGTNAKIPKTTALDLFRKTNYNGSYGTAYIDRTLKIVGDTWWLEREEYDGSEWWEFKKQPEAPTTTITKPNIYHGPAEIER